MVTGTGLPYTHQPQDRPLLSASSPVPNAVASGSRVCDRSCVSPGRRWLVGCSCWKITEGSRALGKVLRI